MEGVGYPYFTILNTPTSWLPYATPRYIWKLPTVDAITFAIDGACRNTPWITLTYKKSTIFQVFYFLPLWDTEVTSENI